MKKLVLSGNDPELPGKIIVTLICWALIAVTLMVFALPLTDYATKDLGRTAFTETQNFEVSGGYVTVHYTVDGHQYNTSISVKYLNAQVNSSLNSGKMPVYYNPAVPSFAGIEPPRAGAWGFTLFLLYGLSIFFVVMWLVMMKKAFKWQESYDKPHEDFQVVPGSILDENLLNAIQGSCTYMAFRRKSIHPTDVDVARTEISVLDYSQMDQRPDKLPGAVYYHVTVRLPHGHQSFFVIRVQGNPRSVLCIHDSDSQLP